MAGYDPAFAAAALLAVTVAMLAMLNIVTRGAVFDGPARAWIVGAGGLALGAGLWSAELLGLLARYPAPPPGWVFRPAVAALGIDLLVGGAAAWAIARPEWARRVGVVGIAAGLALGTLAARLVLMRALPGGLPGTWDLPSAALAFLVALAGAGMSLRLALDLEHLSPERQALRRPLAALVVAVALGAAHAAMLHGLPETEAVVTAGAARADMVMIGLMVAVALLGVMVAVQIAATVHSAAETRAHRALEELRAGMARLDHEVREHRQAREALAAANTALRHHVASERRMLADTAALGELAQALALCLSEAEVARVLAARVPAVLPGSAGMVLRLTADADAFEAFGRWGQPRGLGRFRREDCLAMRAGLPRRLAGGAAAPPCAHLAPATAPDAAVVCAPLAAAGEALGLLVVELPSDAAAPARHQPNVAAGIADRLAFALANVRLRAQAIRDPLTGLYNRRIIEDALGREIARALRDGKSLAVMLVDIDNFKSYNDQHGHAAGDHVIRAVAATLMAQLRTSDVVCRYGGEEFLALLTDVRLHEAVSRAREVCTAVRGLLAVDPRLRRRVTVSAGVAGFPDHGADPTELIRAADLALYAAKAAGRDRVVLAGPPGLPTPAMEEA